MVNALGRCAAAATSRSAPGGTRTSPDLPSTPSESATMPQASTFLLRNAGSARGGRRMPESRVRPPLWRCGGFQPPWGRDRRGSRVWSLGRGGAVVALEHAAYPVRVAAAELRADDDRLVLTVPSEEVRDAIPPEAVDVLEVSQVGGPGGPSPDAGPRPCRRPVPVRGVRRVVPVGDRGRGSPAPTAGAGPGARPARRAAVSRPRRQPRPPGAPRDGEAPPMHEGGPMSTTPTGSDLRAWRQSRRPGTGPPAPIGSSPGGSALAGAARRGPALVAAPKT